VCQGKERMQIKGEREEERKSLPNPSLSSLDVVR
jgi:hypothetical protein